MDAMSKVAKLVAVSLMTRIIVEEGSSEAETLEKAEPKFIATIQTELMDNLEFIDDDTECPYDPETDLES